MATTTAEASSIGEAIGNAASVLVSVPAMDDRESQVCVALMTPAPLEEENVLQVTFVQPPDTRLSAWRESVGDLPDRMVVVDVGGSTRSAAASTQVESGSDPVTIETVGSPGDLTGIGVAISRHLEDWAESENQAVLCFHSITSLLQYTDLRTAFRFLHVLTQQLAGIDAVGHFHIDPTAHDERTMHTLASLFDAVVEPEDDGWSVRRR